MSDVTVQDFESAVSTALRELYGIRGGGLLDSHQVISYNCASAAGVIQCDSNTYTKVWSALSIANKYQGKPALFRVEHVTSCLHTTGPFIDLDFDQAPGHL